MEVSGTPTVSDALLAEPADSTTHGFMISTPLFLFYMGYGIVCWVVYLIIFVKMMLPANRADFSSSFFTIAKVLAVVDLTGYIVIVLVLKMPLTPLFAHFFAYIPPSHAWSLPYFYSFIVEYFRAMLVLAGAVNRFTALINPFEHDKIWKKLTSVALVLSFIVPMLLNWQVLLSEIYTMPFDLNSNDSFAFVKTRVDWYPALPSALNTALFYFVIGILTIMVNVGSLISLYNLKQRRVSTVKENLQLNHHHFLSKTEKSLVLVSFGDSIAMFPIIVINMFLYILITMGMHYDPLFDAMYLQLPWVTDLGRFSRPFLLLLTSKKVREVFLKTFGIYLKSETNSIIVTTNYGGSIAPVTAIMPMKSEHL